MSPFISWTYKMVNSMPGLLAARPGRAISVLLGWQLYNDVNYALMFEGAASEMESRERQALPEYLTGPEARMFLVGPELAARAYDSDPDRLALHDWGRFVFPLSDLGRTRFGDHTMAHPALNLVVAWRTGRTLTRAEFPIKPHDGPEDMLTDTQRAENILAFGDFVRGTILPNSPVVVGSYANKDLVRMLVGEGVVSEEFGERFFGVTRNDRQGLPTTWAKGLGDVVGAKTRQFQLRHLEDAQMGRHYKAVNDAEKRIISLMIQQGRTGSVTEADLTSARKRYDEALAAMWKRQEALSSGRADTQRVSEKKKALPPERKNPFPATPALAQ
jgi:hypothetical protein